MRVALDLFPCQSASRLRGIGRYVRALAGAMLQTQGAHELSLFANASCYPEAANELRNHFFGYPGHHGLYPYQQTTPPKAGSDPALHQAVASLVVQRAYQISGAEIILHAGPFEGWAEPGVVPLPSGDGSQPLQAAILYDFIPYRYPAQYFSHPPGYREWYLKRFEALNQFDLLLAISEATRRDAIELAGLSPERIVTIGGAVGPEFQRREYGPAEREETLARLGIRPPFIFAGCNADYRKNLDGMLHAYRCLPASLREAYPLVLIGQRDERAIRAAGLRPQEVFVLGRVSDADLIFLYNQCAVFVFPSLYEGFGLPVLEAMACGAPVLAGDNSSLPEVVGRSDALFDAASPASIAALLARTLTDSAFRQELHAYGLKRAGLFTWQATARRAWQALEGMGGKPVAADQSGAGTERCALLLTAEEATSSLVAEVVAGLAPVCSLDLFVAGGNETIPSRLFGLRCRDAAEFLSCRRQYALVFYRFANAPSSGALLPLWEEHPGLVILETIPSLAVIARDSAPCLESLFAEHGLKPILAWRRQGEQTLVEWPLVWPLLARATAIVTPDPAGCAAQLHAWYGDCLAPPLLRLPGAAEGVAWRALLSQGRRHDERTLLASLAATLSAGKAPKGWSRSAAKALAWNGALRSPARLLIDVTEISHNDPRTGIQRVVKNIIRELAHDPSNQQPLELVRLEARSLVRAARFSEGLFDLPDGLLGEESTVCLRPGDTLFMLDSSWDFSEDFAPVFEAVHAVGGMIATVLYDLIPIRLPTTCDAGLVRVFARWLRRAIGASDLMLCISRAVADDLVRFIGEEGLAHQPRLGVAHFPLGADIPLPAPDSVPLREEIGLLQHGDTPLFLVVSTIEPRKNHACVLDAFERLWAAGKELRLCFVGREGWQVAPLMRRIRLHPELGRRFWFLESAPDGELLAAYGAATAVIAASLAEGFGLSIVEGALRGLPVIASDIPVFREVGGAGGIYFNPLDSADLVRAIEKFCLLSPAKRQVFAKGVPLATWAESARRVRAILQGGGSCQWLEKSV